MYNLYYCNTCKANIVHTYIIIIIIIIINSYLKKRGNILLMIYLAFCYLTGIRKELAEVWLWCVLFCFCFPFVDQKKKKTLCYTLGTPWFASKSAVRVAIKCNQATPHQARAYIYPMY